MECESPEHFPIQGVHFWRLAGLAGVAVVIVAVGISALLWHDFTKMEDLYLTWACTLFFSVVSLLASREAMRLPKYAINVDTHGMWCAHPGREFTLVPWDQICNVRERPIMQCLELHDEAGRVLGVVFYYLQGYERLREMIVVRLEKHEYSQTLPRTIQSPSGWQPVHVLYIIMGMFGVTALVIVESSGLILTLFGAFVAIILAERLTSLQQIVIYPDHLEFHYPLSRHTCWERKDIVGIDFKDRIDRRTRITYVALRHENGKRFLLPGLEVGTTHLLAILSAWEDGHFVDVTVT